MRLRPRGDQRGAGRPRGDGGRRRLRLLHPAARPARRRTRRSRSSSTAPARASSSSPTGSTTSTRSARPLRERGVRLLYDEPRRGTAGLAGQLRPPQGRRRRARRARRARRGRRTDERACTTRASRRRLPTRVDRPTARTRAPTNPEATVQQILDAILAGDTHRRGLRRPRASRSPTAAVTVHKDEVDMFDGLDQPGQGPAQVPARRRRADCPSSARARRSSR